MIVIDPQVISAVREWLGEDGRRGFAEYLEKYGTVSPVISVSLPSGKPFPHLVHFREGMQVRNFLRGLPECSSWSDNDLDDHWATIVEEALR